MNVFFRLAGLFLVDNGAGSTVTLGIDNRIVATVSGSTFTQLSGSLQKTSAGLSYLVGAGSVTVTSGSNGQIVISGSSGAAASSLIFTGTWRDAGSSAFVTTGSVSVDTGNRASTFYGADNFFYVSGSIGAVSPSGARKVAAFGGDTFISGTLCLLADVSANKTIIDLDNVGYHYPILQTHYAGSQITWGNASFYSTLDGYSVTINGNSGGVVINSSQFTANSTAVMCLSGSMGVSTYDARNSLYTDHAVVAKYLHANATTTSTTRQNTNLSFAVAANEVWVLTVEGALGSSGATGVQLGISGPAGITGQIVAFGCATAANAYSSTVSTSFNSLVATLSNATSAPRMFRMTATAIISSTPGTVTIQFATFTSGTATMYAGASLVARRANRA